MIRLMASSTALAASVVATLALAAAATAVLLVPKSYQATARLFVSTNMASPTTELAAGITFSQQSVMTSARPPRSRCSAFTNAFTCGSIRRGTPHEIANETSVNTAFGVERVVRYAFDLAERRRKRLTLVHKTNVLVHAGQTWQQAFDRVKVEYPEVETDYCHVDAASMFFLTNPERFDVIVTDNLFGDILTDIGAAIAGGIGLAASGNLDVTRSNPSMFEPVHGSAPDIAGQGKADPTATILSVAMLLDHLGAADAAKAVEDAVSADLASRGSAARSTSEVGDAIAARL